MAIAKRGDDSTGSDQKSEPAAAPGDQTKPPPAAASTNNAGPPTQADLPKGAVLYRGTSGDEIGCIPCDGAFRIMALDKSGVTLSGAGGPQERSLMSAPLTSNGRVDRLGVRVSQADGGSWTLNIRCLSTSTPGSCGLPPEKPQADNIGFVLACTLPIGSATCPQWAPPDGRQLKAGDRLALAVGNPGKPVTEGHFTMEWWSSSSPTELRQPPASNRQNGWPGRFERDRRVVEGDGKRSLRTRQLRQTLSAGRRRG